MPSHPPLLHPATIRVTIEVKKRQIATPTGLLHYLPFFVPANPGKHTRHSFAIRLIDLYGQGVFLDLWVKCDL